ncbi:MAG: hypothetical protein HRU71_06735 [Planctomycetia bacterium]|nr:MAG: hypothetical protein HRU71_06735 [Planctomycetia bacterium]RIK66596.1 MAG: hypothetical protein DCC66_12900 [Planctomycetota bacterium]
MKRESNRARRRCPRSRGFIARLGAGAMGWFCLIVAVSEVAVAQPTVAPASAASEQIEGRIQRVGLFSEGVPLVRSGNWSFIDVSLRFRGDRPFEGELRVSQSDRDGDIATSVAPVTLAPGAEWRSYQVYFVPNEVSGTAGPPSVRLYDAEGRRASLLDETGEVVKELTGQPVLDLPADEFLVVDLSSPRRLAHVAWLDSKRRQQSNWINARHVRAMPPRALPSRWQGLDAVDAIVWDDADPSGLSPQQIAALMDWVREGGRLLLTGGRNWQMLANSPLAEALPVTLIGVEERTEALEFLDIVEHEEYASRLTRRYARNPITRCRMEPRPGSIPVPPRCPNPQIAHRRFLGRGVVTFVGASLNELLPVPRQMRSMLVEDEPDLDATEDAFLNTACETVVARRLLALPFVYEDKDVGIGARMFGRVDLYSVLRQSISFESVGAAFVVIAIAFGLAYWFVATIGSHHYLKRRGWLHVSWSAFAVVSVVSSVVGMMMVWGLRGVTTRLWQTSVVDALAGRVDGCAVNLFGVRTPDHARLDLRLPTGDASAGESRGGPLRVVPESDSIQGTSSKFAAPEAYRARLGGEWLDDVPIRATLKEFTGTWHGPIGGSFDGKLVSFRNTGSDRAQIPYEFGEGSFLRNGLPVALESCYLVETDELVAGEGRNVLARCFAIGDLNAGQELSAAQLRDRLYTLFDPAKPADPPARRPRLPLLSDQLLRWGAALNPMSVNPNDPRAPMVDSEYNSALLLSFSDLIREDSNGRSAVRRTHGRSLDCSRLLTPTTALLIGYSREPGPAVLEVDRVALKPNQSRTIYRFVIPVERSWGRAERREP